MIELGLKFTLAYLLGSVLGSMVVGYLRGGIDIRKLGSGNPGGTNALRTQGKWFAVCVLLIDVGKGIFAVAVIPSLSIAGVGVEADVSRDLVLYSVALGVIVGHMFPLWFDFRGGKGGATAAGVLFYLAPALAVPVVVFWILVIVLTGYVGLATMAASLAAAAYVGVTDLPESYGFFAFVATVAALIVYAHRGNILRMWNGTEARFRRLPGSKQGEP